MHQPRCSSLRNSRHVATVIGNKGLFAHDKHLTRCHRCPSEVVHTATMQWRRRYCCTHVARLLSLLSLLVVLVILRHQDWLPGIKGPTLRRGNPVAYTEGGLHSIDKGNHSSSQIQLRDAPVPPAPPKMNANLSSPQADSSPQRVTGLESSLATNASLSGEVGLGGLLTLEPYTYIINEPNKCREGDPEPLLVLLIATEAQQVEAREAIRQTWGNESVVPGLVRLFLLGVKEGEVGRLQQSSLEAESRRHRDIIQQDFMDTYNNLTIKTLMGMHWVAAHCPGTNYVMKTDSDMFVNTEYLVHKLLQPKNLPKRDYFTGYLMKGYAPNRNKNSKWYMSHELYPSERYPTFCSGTGYVFSGDLAGKIYRASLGIRRLHLEDVYTGICLAKLRIEPTPPPNEFLFNHWRVSYSSCKYSHLITSHQFHPNELLKYWHHLQRNKHNACINTFND
ncbi:beta-1,3-galactosyltransferase 2 [Oncorhynchus kisutch]|uniref:Hexosyltransferase n=1 Tax=Oncorhynchus kisutch TaxID=8019 RepID=A0A8C7ING2_ONCKI|nr:beta-1,3-galactosyltransferase 2 [Oncorhynchus kisutch]XP_020318951.1 beta-1,3-galactosyltransferase 2 [Oncorhynchus kisutch]XP_020318952.1 beta-1,3-galactosyltransferase 2 [Oncorhynchus kisutch]